MLQTYVYTHVHEASSVSELSVMLRTTNRHHNALISVCSLVTVTCGAAETSSYVVQIFTCEAELWKHIIDPDLVHWIRIKVDCLIMHNY